MLGGTACGGRSCRRRPSRACRSSSPRRASAPSTPPSEMSLAFGAASPHLEASAAHCALGRAPSADRRTTRTRRRRRASAAFSRVFGGAGGGRPRGARSRTGRGARREGAHPVRPAARRRRRRPRRTWCGSGGGWRAIPRGRRRRRRRSPRWDQLSPGADGLVEPKPQGGDLVDGAGTRDYMAPEILLETGYHHGCDIVVLGVVMFEMLVAYPPFYGDDPLRTCRKILCYKETLRSRPRRIDARCRASSCERSSRMPWLACLHRWRHTAPDTPRPHFCRCGQSALRPRRPPRPHLLADEIASTRSLAASTGRRCARSALRTSRAEYGGCARRTPPPPHPAAPATRYKPRVSSITDTSNFDSPDERLAEGKGRRRRGRRRASTGWPSSGISTAVDRSSSAEIVGRASPGTPPPPGSGAAGDDDAPVATSTRMCGHRARRRARARGRAAGTRRRRRRRGVPGAGGDGSVARRYD